LTRFDDKALSVLVSKIAQGLAKECEPVLLIFGRSQREDTELEDSPRVLRAGGRCAEDEENEGLGLDRFKGQAWYVGPTFFAKLGTHTSLSGAWNVQVAGKAADEPGALDLVNFERHQFLLRFNALLNPK
jgi:hypothetical protein